MKKLLGLLAVVTLLSGTGCASAVATTYTDAKIPYAGTIVDGCGVAYVGKEPGIAALALVDMPMSMALDTVLLPVTLTRFATR